MHFKCIVDLVSHSVRADTRNIFAYCRCGREGCTKYAITLHTCKLHSLVSWRLAKPLCEMSIVNSFGLQARCSALPHTLLRAFTVWMPYW